jgi:tripartite-type tricarboxylate transporter receptor subunit TctC
MLAFGHLSAGETVMMSRLILFAVAALLAVLHGPAAASAESYPQRAVRFILPFGPGAGVDITARMLAERLAARWGKPVVVENRPGGDGIVAINAFTSAQDDHTLLFVPTSTFTAHPYTHDKLPYDPQRDLLPIATVTVIVIALASPESLKVASLGDFVAMARARPGTLNAAAAPGNSDFVLAGFLKDMNLQVAKVPYRNIMQAPNDLAEGRIQLLMSSYASMRGLIEAGRLKVLAVTSRKRVGIAPEIPTVADAGFPFLGLDGLIGVFGPRGMPDAMREGIAADIASVVAADPTIAARLAATGQLSMCADPQNSRRTSKSSTASSRTSPRRLGSRPRSERCGESREMSSEDENAIRVLADIEKSERHLLDLYQEHSHGLVQYQHLYLFGIARRPYTIATFCSEE